MDSTGENEVSYLNKDETLKSKLVKRFLLTNKIEKDVLWGVQGYKNSLILNGERPFINTVFIPNGYCWENNTPIVPFKERNNTIVTVARNGTEQKHTDMLMNGFAQISHEYPEWELLLAGTVEESFQPFINDYFNKYPELRERVRFIGPIIDRDELQEFYNNSKMFCLTSLWEGYGLVTIEALSMGCFVLESNIEANKATTNDGKYGALFENGDINDFVEKLRYYLKHQDEMEQISKDACNYTQKHYKWENVLKPIDEWVKKKSGN
jgi:glycosyltransferase involved in cell wall biosynthesis